MHIGKRIHGKKEWSLKKRDILQNSKVKKFNQIFNQHMHMIQANTHN